MKFDTDKIIGLSAMAIGLASLGVVYYQAQLQREQMELERKATAASVLPYLMTNVSFSPEGSSFNLRNVGIGPALIDGVRVLHKGTVFSGDPHAFWLENRKDMTLGSNVDPVKVGRLVSAGEWVQMLGISGDQATRDRMGVEIIRLFTIAEAQSTGFYELLTKDGIALEGAVLEVTYSDVFGKQWVLRSDNIVPQPRP